MAQRIILAGFLLWNTPAGDVRLVDGGTLAFNGEQYRASHPVFGSISDFQPINEGVGDEAPAGTLTFSPAPEADPSVVNSPALQGTRIRMWIGEVDGDTGQLTGPPDLMLDGIGDVTRLKLARGSRQLEFDIASRSERLFLLNEGNVLSGEFHRSIYPGERGLDNAVAVSTTVAWGVASKPRGTA